MPFNGSGTFTIINTFVPNTTILSSAVNANFADIATGLTDCLTRDGQAGMTAALKAISGSAGAPSITFTSDTTTGLFLDGSGNLGLSAGGIEVLKLNSLSQGRFTATLEATSHLVVGLGSTSTNINSIATAGTGVINIGTSTSWPTPGYLLAGTEIMSYTVASATGLTITGRGAMSTTATAHATGATIETLFSGFSANETLLPSRATASRAPFPPAGDFAYNSGAAVPEFYNGSTWVSLSQPKIVPQGYLSVLSSPTPIVTTDLTSQTSIFYNPYVGNLIPIPVNGSFTLQTFTTSSIALSASQTTGGIYDIYGFISTTNSTLTFGISPSWAAGSSGSVAPGSCARGTGAGGTALTSVTGLYTNAVAMTILNGANSYSIASQSGVYLGSIYIGATAGTVNMHTSFGQNRQWGVWNAFNSMPVYLMSGESTASWTYATAAYRVSNNTTANSLNVLSGLATDIYALEFIQNVTATAGSVLSKVGVGVNSVTSAAGFVGQGNFSSVTSTRQGKFLLTPQLGVSTISSLEFGGAGITFNGTESNMRLAAQWKA